MATNFTGIFNCTADVSSQLDKVNFGMFDWDCTQYPSLPSGPHESEKLNCTRESSWPRPSDSELSGIFNCSLAFSLETNSTSPRPGVSNCTQYPSVKPGFVIYCTRPSSLQSYSNLSRTFNCTHYPPVQADPDISGIGVLSAFMGTAYLALICCIAKAIVDYKRTTNVEIRSSLDRWAFALGEVIVILSDQQVITGISILVGGFSQLQSGITIYHWQTIFNLAWFSTMTHLLTLTVLRDEVRSNTPIRSFRVVGMTVLILMLVAVMFPIGYTVGGSQLPLNFPALCLYRPGLDWGWWETGISPETFEWSVMEGETWPGLIEKKYGRLYVTFILVVLVYSFVSRSLLLLSENFSFSRTFLRIPTGQPWSGAELILVKLGEQGSRRRCIRVLQVLGYKLICSTYALSITGRDMYQSRTWEITWLSFALVWGTLRILQTRFDPEYFEATIISPFRVGYLPDDVTAKQNIWSFGQVVALGLLVLPLASFFGAFHSVRPNNIVSSSDALTRANPLSFNRSLPLGAEVSQARSLTMLQPKSHSCVTSCQKKLFWLWYLLSIKTGIFFLMKFATGSAPYDLQSFVGLLGGVKFVMIPAAVDIGVLWLFTAIFLDHHIHNAWNTRKFVRHLFKSPFPLIGWGFSISIVVAASVLWELYYNYGFPGEYFDDHFLVNGLSRG